ncbi:MAG: hypothetical protein ACOX3Y_02665 [Clostridia bacterium]
MKKLIKEVTSIVLTLCLILTAITPAFAYTNGNSTEKDDSFFLNSIQGNVHDGSVEVLEVIDNGKGVKDIKVKYSNGIIAQIKEKRIDNKIQLDVVEGTLKNKLIIDMESNSIILDGKNVKITSIQEVANIEEIDINRNLLAASWVYSKNPVYGSPGDYTRYIGYTNYNVNFETAIDNITFAAYIAVISVIISGGSGIPAAVFGVGAVAFYEYVKYYDPKTQIVYMKETQHYHETLNFYKKHFCQYYTNSNFTNPYSDSTFYSGWAGGL